MSRLLGPTGIHRTSVILEDAKSTGESRCRLRGLPLSLSDEFTESVHAFRELGTLLFDLVHSREVLVDLANMFKELQVLVTESGRYILKKEY